MVLEDFRKNTNHLIITFLLTIILIVASLYKQNVYSMRENVYFNKIGSSVNLTSKLSKLNGKDTKLDQKGLWRDVKILCIIHTCPRNLETKAKYVKQAWSFLCNKTLFVSDEINATFPTIKVTNRKGSNEIWAKSRRTLEWVYSKYLNKFDWFFKADDDTYVIMDNLRRFLYKKDATKLEWYGKVMTNGINRGLYPQGGAGYAFGSAALKRLVEVGFKSGQNCPNASLKTHGDDMCLGVCLDESGINLVKDCLDSRGRELFHALGVKDEFFLPVDRKRAYYKYSLNKIVTETCCSNESISFHKVPGRDQLFIDYLMRRFVRPN